jgi:hypothetical protein
VVGGSGAEISELHATSIFRIEVCMFVFTLWNGDEELSILIEVG